VDEIGCATLATPPTPPVRLESEPRDGMELFAAAKDPVDAFVDLAPITWCGFTCLVAEYGLAAPAFLAERG